jgi:hypothetical protein
MRQEGKKERAERTMPMRVTITLTLMVFIRMLKRCRVMTTWTRMRKKKGKKSRVEKGELTLKRRELKLRIKFSNNTTYTRKSSQSLLLFSGRSLLTATSL